uniref:Nuclear receptor domain-containing protein n=1 Tax=Clastoptera arizonana TaxID=38151 RepID=A0A1B6EGZ0_9HEMI
MSNQGIEAFDSKVCGVCGDIALGYNFNAVTCESCKAFFRRNALKVKTFHCPFQEKCNLTAVTRRFCQKCRLEKCFLIGMKKELILSPEEKEIKRRKIMANKSVESKPCCDLIRNETKIDSATAQTNFNHFSFTYSLPNTITSIIYKAVELEFEPCSVTRTSVSNELTSTELERLDELINANEDFFAPISIETLLVGHIKDIITLTAIAVRRLIKMSKLISAFKNMCQDDQMALLKGGCTELMILRSVMTYDPNKNTWKIPYSKKEIKDLKIDVLKEAKSNIYDEHQQFLRTFNEEWRTNQNIMLLLSAIILFSPERPKIIHRDVVKLEQNSYYYLLRRYLESIYPGCKARSTFLKLIQKVSELHQINENHIKFFLDFNPHDIEPLLIEIFDLKMH